MQQMQVKQERPQLRITSYMLKKSLLSLVNSLMQKHRQRENSYNMILINQIKNFSHKRKGWGISTNDMKSALSSLKTLEGLPDCNVQCQEMVKDSISKLDPALENRINKHSSQTENLKELTGILAAVIVMNESGLIDGRATTSGGVKGVPNGTETPKIDNSAKNNGQKGKETSPIINQPHITVISPEIETKILSGQRVGNSNKLIGGHSPSVNNENPNYAVEAVRLNPDGTRVVKFTTSVSWWKSIQN
nr:hypothetical protein [Providencia sp. wls1948]